MKPMALLLAGCLAAADSSGTRRSRNPGDSGSLIGGTAAAEPFRAGPGVASRGATAPLDFPDGFDAAAWLVERRVGGFPL
jgi:hypothetical protein